jgi:hypothetical protein
VWRFVRGLKPEVKKYMEVNAPEGDGWTDLRLFVKKQPPMS